MSGRYSRKAIDHFMNPRNSGRLDGATGQGRAINDAQDVVTFFIAANDQIVEKAMFQAQGCAACIASASIATEMMVGRTLKEAAELTNLDLLSEALDGLPSSKLSRAKVTVAAIRVALEQHTTET
ncbi:MAG: nitrogen fixation NifU-like protein [Myxococcota bacterium]|jgi:nitrogen fixation NifU-like protein